MNAEAGAKAEEISQTRKQAETVTHIRMPKICTTRSHKRASTLAADITEKLGCTTLREMERDLGSTGIPSRRRRRCATT